MSFENSEAFTKENLDLYFKELSKEYKKLGGRNFPIEVILIGGAAIIENYGFRDMTTDIDAILPAVSIMKDAINHVGDRFGLPNGWLNADFMQTVSYSSRLNQYSVPYKTFNQVLNVRMITGEYLIAMKLRSGRKYKNDLSDVVGILAAHAAVGNPISYDMIDTAVNNLYAGWEEFPKDSISFIKSILAQNDLDGLYREIREGEQQTRSVLLDFQDRYPGALKEEIIDSVLEKKQDKTESVLSALRERKEQKNDLKRGGEYVDDRV